MKNNRFIILFILIITLLFPISCDVINKNLKVKYVNEDNKFGYLKLEDVKFTPSMDKKKKIEEEDNDYSL